MLIAPLDNTFNISEICPLTHHNPLRMQVQSFVFSPFAENTLVLFDETKEAIIIDPGCYEAAERQVLQDFIHEQELHVTKLVNTHCHIDHVLGNAWVKRTYGVELYIHPEDAVTLKMQEVIGPNYGFVAYESSEAEHYLQEGDEVQFGQTSLRVLFVPGHAPGHIALVHDADHITIGGDVLFKQSIGRTDLPGGDHQTLINSIREKLFALPDEMVVYPGHGPVTTIGEEKQSNPFCGLHLAH